MPDKHHRNISIPPSQRNHCKQRLGMRVCRWCHYRPDAICRLHSLNRIVKPPCCWGCDHHSYNKKHEKCRQRCRGRDHSDEGMCERQRNHICGMYHTCCWFRHPRLGMWARHCYSCVGQVSSRLLPRTCWLLMAFRAAKRVPQAPFFTPIRFKLPYVANFQQHIPTTVK